MEFLKKQAGVTLNELIMSVAIVAVLLGTAAPNLSEYMERRAMTGEVELIASFLANAKLESIKRNQFITVSYKQESGGAAWCLGAALGTNQVCDCMAETPQCVIDSVPFILSNDTESDVIAKFTNGSYTYNPVRGVLTDTSLKVDLQMEHDVKNYRATISINGVGRISQCSPAGYSLSGYRACSS